MSKQRDYTNYIYKAMKYENPRSRGWLMLDRTLLINCLVGA